MRMVASCLSAVTVMNAQAPVIEKVDPPNWWGRHTINPVRVLIRGKHLTGAQLTCPRLQCARVNVNAAGTYAFELGFSDIATVFLNGRTVFRGDGTFTTDTPRREGLIGYDQARLYLPLAAGDNECRF